MVYVRSPSELIRPLPPIHGSPRVWRPLSVLAVRPHAEPSRKMQVYAMELLVIVAVVLIFELAAARWGFDSRDLFRHRDD